mmetsp:Transcript_106727/g.278637  ORF Transcript_106727/g.278637 Transcript_106727/m.278637 type:complete len:309 (-) Transcript_106727:474-1400(-)
MHCQGYWPPSRCSIVLVKRPLHANSTYQQTVRHQKRTECCIHCIWLFKHDPVGALGHAGHVRILHPWSESAHVFHPSWLYQSDDHIITTIEKSRRLIHASAFQPRRRIEIGIEIPVVIHPTYEATLRILVEPELALMSSRPCWRFPSGIPTADEATGGSHGRGRNELCPQQPLESGQPSGLPRLPERIPEHAVVHLPRPGGVLAISGARECAATPAVDLTMVENIIEVGPSHLAHRLGGAHLGRRHAGHCGRRTAHLPAQGHRHAEHRLKDVGPEQRKVPRADCSPVVANEVSEVVPQDLYKAHRVST